MVISGIFQASPIRGVTPVPRPSSTATQPRRRVLVPWCRRLDLRHNHAAHRVRTRGNSSHYSHNLFTQTQTLSAVMANNLKFITRPQPLAPTMPRNLCEAIMRNQHPFNSIIISSSSNNQDTMLNPKRTSSRRRPLHLTNTSSHAPDRRCNNNQHLNQHSRPLSRPKEVQRQCRNPRSPRNQLRPANRVMTCVLYSTVSTAIRTDTLPRPSSLVP